jgi:hypothetical protein
MVDTGEIVANGEMMVMIAEEKYRRKGLAREAILLMIGYGGLSSTSLD